ncbi:MAG: hypothetical protein IT236_17700 [Bacteroidia bacterium]|nr:hypothetical protein [Bacteroidia bacterium]
MIKYALIVFAISLVSCSKTDAGERDSDQKPIAKAGTDKLYEENIKEALMGGGSKKDSAYYLKKSIERWATEALFYQEALSKLDKEEIQVEKQVEEYRRELVNYIYSNRIIEANLDTVISNAEIEAYYNEHRDNFILKENIIKVNYIKVPVKASGLEKIKRLLFAGQSSDAQQLKQLCSQNAENYFINDSTWLYMDEIKKEIPALKDESDLNLGAGRVVQFADESYYYYLKIKDVKIKNALSPINFERQNIKKFIINNRKAQLIMQYKQLLLEKAKTAKNFETY